MPNGFVGNVTTACHAATSTGVQPSIPENGVAAHDVLESSYLHPTSSEPSLISIAAPSAKHVTSGEFIQTISPSKYVQQGSFVLSPACVVGLPMPTIQSTADAARDEMPFLHNVQWEELSQIAMHLWDALSTERENTVPKDMARARITARLAKLSGTISFDVNPAGQSMVKSFIASMGTDSTRSVIALAIANLDQFDIKRHLESLAFDLNQDYDPILRKMEIEWLAAEASMYGPLFPEFFEEESGLLHLRLSQNVDRTIQERQLQTEHMDDFRNYFLLSLRDFYCPP